jgi:tetratricopeptide (TPR) repeat protein
MANELVIADTYYNRTTATGYGYRDFVEKQTKNITSTMRENSEREIAATIASAELVAGSVRRMQAGITTAIDDQTEVMQTGFNSVNNTLQTSFSRVTNELGRMSVEMNLGFARTEKAIDRLSADICGRLDKITNILETPRGTAARELYNNAVTNYRKGFYEEALPDIQKAVEMLTTDYLSWFLEGEIYAFGAGKFSNIIDLDKSIAAYTNAAKYIIPDAEKSEDAKRFAAEINFYLGLAQYARSNELFHAGNQAESGALLSSARDSFMRSYQYSALMLEARYNAARCKALLGDASGALADLEALIKEEALYCVKAEIESDFDVIRGDYRRLIEKMRVELYEETAPVYKEITGGYELAKQEGLTQYFAETVQISRVPVNFDRSRGLISQATIPLFEQVISAGIDKSLPYLDMRERTLPYPALLNIIRKGVEAVFQTVANNDGSVTILKYAGADTQVVIPGSIGGKPVTEIWGKAFEKTNLTSVEIPGSVKTIGGFAFSGNQLMSVVIPGSVTTIGDGAFSKNQLTSVEIPDSITTIGNFAFFENQLTSVKIPGSVTTIGKSAFSVNRLASVEIPGSVTTIGDGAFSFNQLTSVTIGNGVTSIGENAFFGNQLTSVEIPGSVTTIGKDAFGKSASNRAIISPITIGANVNIGEWTPGFDSYYNKEGKKAGRYVYAAGSGWTRYPTDAKEIREKRKDNVWMGIGALLGLVPLVGGFVVGHWFIGIIIAIATAFVGFSAFVARGWGILVLAIIGGGIALGIHMGHPFIFGIIGFIAGFVVCVAGFSHIQKK